jgi:hypothetical protein
VALHKACACFNKDRIKHSQTWPASLFYLMPAVFNQRLTNISKTEAPQTRCLLNLEIDTLNAMENQLREQIRKLAEHGCELQRERMDKIEQLA